MRNMPLGKNGGGAVYSLGPVSQKFRNFWDLFQVPHFPFYLGNADVLSHQTLQSSCFFRPLKTSQKINFSKQLDFSLTTGFSDPKSSWDFRETDPWIASN